MLLNYIDILTDTANERADLNNPDTFIVGDC